MSVLGLLFGRERLVLSLALVLALLGVAAWQTMPRQEDPRLPELWGLATVAWPGADVLSLERLVVEPMEEALAEVEQLRRVQVQVRAGFATLQLELRGSVADVERAWDEVEDALAEARRVFPTGVGAPRLDHELQDQEAIVLAVSGSPDRLRLANAAERLREALLTLGPVKRATRIGDPGEQITVALDDEAAARFGISPQQVADQLARRNGALPGGSIVVGEKRLSLRPNTEFGSLAAIVGTPVRLPSGSSVPLERLAAVARTPAQPMQELMRVDGRPAVGVGVVPRQGINSIVFGAQVRARVEAMLPQLAPLQVEELRYQPAHVEKRLDGLERSLLLGTLLIAAGLFLAMGARLGVLVAAGVPLVMFSTVFVYALGGGVLHQMSVAALVIALGILVDNGIVVSESIQARLDAGAGPRRAALQAVRELAVPLASATGTTMAAFLPMLLSSGPTAAFTSAIPVVVMLALGLSYLYSVSVTPLLGRRLLRPRPENRRAAGLGDTLGRFAVRRPRVVLGVAVLVVAVALSGFGAVPQQFFPASDRQELLVELNLPEGTHLTGSSRPAAELERALARRPEVTRVATYLGRSVPHFYYNLPQEPHLPHAARLVVDVDGLGRMAELQQWLHGYVRRALPEAEVVVRRIEQGPPVAAPVEVRLYGDDLSTLAVAAGKVFAVVRGTDGVRDVRHSLGAGVPTLRLAVDDAVAARYGVDRSDVAQGVFGRSRGLPAGYFRAEDDPIPIRVRSPAGERFPVEDLEGVQLFGDGGAPVPLAQVARLEPDWQPAMISRRDQQRVVTVSAQLAPGRAYSDVLARLQPRLDALDLPDGIRYGYGGDAEGAGEANTALVTTMPLGALVLVGILLAQFNSFRRVLLVLVTVPLAFAGIVPGLLLGGQPFGFMSLLGVFALVGVVVNNAIVLLDCVERERRGGARVALALRRAVAERTRPILLTSATTAAGLLPLALIPSPLWPPLAWAMLSGLAASTGLTLLVVPALYRLLFREGRAGLV